MTVLMEGADNTATESEGRSAAVAERAEDRDINARNHAHSGYFPIVRRKAQRFARAHHHPRVDG